MAKPAFINVTLLDGTPYTVKELVVNGDSNTKLRKSNKASKGYITAGVSLAPANESKVINVCGSASNGCIDNCIFKSGYGNMPSTIRGRVAKTVAFAQNRKLFFDMLVHNLNKFDRKAKREDKILAARLNMFSDLMWEKLNPSLFTEFSHFQYYDYTKHYKRMMLYLNGGLPKNYHLTFSRSETNDKECREVIKNGGNVAVVFGNSLPKEYYGVEVVNGDETDLRFLDGINKVVGLTPKGKGKQDKSGFVVWN